MKYIFTFILIMLFELNAGAQYRPNYDESKVPEFKLPDPLRNFNGKKVRNLKRWEKKRRPELLEFFTQNVYGEVPGKIAIESVETVERSEEALRMLQETAVFNRAHKPKILICMMLF